MGVGPIVSCSSPQQLADAAQETGMPVHPWRRKSVRENVEAAAHNVGLGDTLADAKRTDVAARQVSSLVQLSTRFQKDRIGAFLIKVFKDHVLEARPLIDEAIFVLFHFARDQKVFSRPL